MNIDPDGRETGIAYHSEFVAMGATPQYYISPNDKVGAPLAAGMSMLPVIGTGMAIGNAITTPSTGTIVGAALSVLPAGTLLADSFKGASAAERATAIAGSMSARTQRSVTIAVTETKEGIRVV